VIAFDSSGLIKLVVLEAETVALRSWLEERPGSPWVASELCRVELPRAVARLNPAAAPQSRALLAGLDLQPVTATLLDLASTLGPPALRSLDAIHLASVLALDSDLEAFVVYDERLAAAAAAAGIPVAQPR